MYSILPYMEANCHPFLGLAADADGRNDRRKSRLMLANSFLADTFFSSSLFCFASIGNSLAHLKSNPYVQRRNKLRKFFEMIHEIVYKSVLWIPLSLNLKPRVTTVWAANHKLVELLQWYVSAPLASQALELNTANVADLDNDPFFGSQFAPLVMP
jgi:hypothetical protein